MSAGDGHAAMVATLVAFVTVVAAPLDHKRDTSSIQTSDNYNQTWTVVAACRMYSAALVLPVRLCSLYNDFLATRVMVSAINAFNSQHKLCSHPQNSCGQPQQV
ncbi:unnamed protein product [Polarella glacialis]|uniref:Secreted protein n=1 Tax=Polarella glacialis TaxID=89957 RepID=A0A813D0R4_POLGL|nr:unnamed protein product [Polarella glacialis]